MRHILRIVGLIAGLSAGTNAHAGPWLRGDGEGFLAFSAEVPATGGDAFFALYAEYGLRQNLTLGFDLGGRDETLDKAVVFARVPLLADEATVKIAIEMGMGLTKDQPVFRSGLSIGRGISFGKRSGWTALDVLANSDAITGATEVSADLTLGVNMSQRVKLIMQLQGSQDLMAAGHLKFAPSMVYEHSPGQHLELGMLTGVENAKDLTLKLGLWHSF